MIVSISQPAYLPWLGYFHRIAVSDVHVVLDHVQMEKNSFTNRNRVRTSAGSTWLTVPVKTSGRFGDLAIADVEVAGDGWARKHHGTIAAEYARAPHFAEHAPFLADVYSRKWPRLLPLLDVTTAHMLKALDVHTPLRRSSGLGIETKKSALVLDVCKALGATVYLSGPLGRGYLDEPAFAAAGIAVLFHDYAHPTYPQSHPGFEANMSALDLLLCAGPNAAAIVRSGNVTRDELQTRARAVRGEV